MKSTYKKEDVTLLLKDITGLLQPEATEERERQIQAGRHYSEMLPLEYVPSEEYMRAYYAALESCAEATAAAVGVLADRIIIEKGRAVVLVSLARAGIPIGILLKRYLKRKYDVDVPHYTISIIRGRGIDKNAIAYLLERYAAERLLFVDGWIGKGAIGKELREAVKDFPGLSGELAALADPANITRLCGTHEDILIPSSCLNCTVSGLISRTVLRDDIIGPQDFHGAVYYGEMQDKDVSYAFIQEIESRFQMDNQPEMETPAAGTGREETEEIAGHFGITDVNMVKPGIGETTRVLLRRVPWRVLVAEGCREDPALHHLLTLAKEKKVPVEYYPLRHYKACGIIRKLADT